jgi:hypothetical protein
MGRSLQEQPVPATHYRYAEPRPVRSPGPGAATISEPSFDQMPLRPADCQPPVSTTVIGHQHSHCVLPGVALKYRCVDRVAFLADQHASGV